MPKNFYPVFICSLLLVFLVFSGWSALKANTPGTNVTDRDYYSKGLKYNSTLVEKRAASVLGWKINAQINTQKLQILLVDGDGTPVQGATGQLLISSQQQTTLPLTETSPGSYLVQLPATLTGEISVRVDFERAGARINRQLLLNI